MRKPIQRQINLATAALAALLLCALCSTELYANSVLGVNAPSVPVTLTQNAGAPPPYNSLDVTQNGNVGGTPTAGSGVTANFNLANGTNLTIQTEGNVAGNPGTIQTTDGASPLITVQGADANATLYIVNSGVMSTGGIPTAALFNAGGLPVSTRFYNISNAQGPATLQTTSVNLASTGSNVYLQFGVNASIPQDVLPMPPFVTPAGGPPLPLGQGGLNADASANAIPQIITDTHTTIFVQGFTDITLGLSSTAANAGTLRVNTYSALQDRGLIINSAIGTAANPLLLFSEEGGRTDLNGGAASLFTITYTATGGTFSNFNSSFNAATTVNNTNATFLNAGAFIAPTLNNNAGGIFTNQAGGTYTGTTINNTGMFTNGNMVNVTTLMNNAGGNFTNNGAFHSVNASNSGTIVNTEGFTATTAVTNNVGGIITNSNAITTPTLNNTGSITNALGANIILASTLNNNAGGTISNSGSISNVPTITNSGTITNNAGGTMTGATTLINNADASISNSGSINNVATITNSGTITNNAGGTMTGITTTNNNAGGIFTVQTGSAFGITNLANAGTFNLGALLNINGNNFSNTAAGSDSFNITSGGNLHITAGNAVNSGIMSLTSGGTITGAAGGSLTNNGTMSISGSNISIPTFTNSGALLPTTSFSLTGNYIQTAAGTLSTTIQSGTSSLDQFFVSGTGSVSGTLDVNYTGSGIGIANGQTFDVILTNGLINNNPTVVSPANPFLTFVLDKDPGTPPHNVRIKAVRPSAATLAGGNPSLLGVSGAILSLFSTGTQNAALANLLNTLAASQNGVIVSELTQLLPLVNGMEVIPSMYSFYPLFDEIAKHLDQLRLGKNSFTDNHLNNLGSGYMAGDLANNNGSYGPIFFGNWMQQQSIGNLDGYNAQTGGIAVVIDTPVNCYLKIGTGVSYATTGAKTFNTGNSVFINSAQGLVYGCLDYFNYVFIDGMGAIAQNNYRTTRNIAFLNESAQASFTGVQATGKGRAGFNVLFDNLMVTPLATLLYVRLNQRQYTEHGAPGANLTVIGNHVTAAEAGYGLKLSEVSEPDRFIPEIHAFYIRNFKDPGLSITSQFTAGGPAFVTLGPNFPRSGGNIGGSISIKFNEYSAFQGGYDIEVRKNFVSHSLSLKFRMLF